MKTSDIGIIYHACCTHTILNVSVRWGRLEGERVFFLSVEGEKNRLAFCLSFLFGFGKYLDHILGIGTHQSFLTSHRTSPCLIEVEAHYLK